jgi:uncharacterized membrane protein
VSQPDSQKNPFWLWAPVVLAGHGVFVSTYLSVKRFTGGSLVCSRWADCDVVNNSVYATLLGVPVAFLGVAGYLVLLGLALAALQAEGIRQRRVLTLGFLLAVGGLAFSVYLTYLEVFVIEALCSWCVASAIIVALLVVVGAINLWRTAPAASSVVSAA